MFFVLPLAGCETLGKSLHLSMPWFPPCEMKTMKLVFVRCFEIYG